MSDETLPAAVGARLEPGVRPRIVAENDDWKLGCFMEWRAKSHLEVCPTCHGSKEVGGGFKSLDGPRECPECFGIGHITKGPKTPAPEIPAEMREHMRRAWFDFLHGA